MTRWAGFVLIIWGLIFHSQVFAAPVNLVDHEAKVIVSSDIKFSSRSDVHENHHSQDINNTSKAPCHKKAISGESPADHDMGGADCLANGSCASFCVLSGVAVDLKLMINSEPQITSVISTKTNHIGFDFLSRIYHPPRLS